MTTIDSALASLDIGKPLAHGGLVVFPLACNTPHESKYLLLEEAIDRKLVHVTEVSESGAIPELLLANEASQPVFLLDGEELVGAKQNRIINLSILAPANSTIKIPVSCVEQGRWSYSDRDFKASKSMHFSEARARKMAQVSHSMEARNERASNQGEIWQSISEKSRNLGSASATAAMSDIYKQNEKLLAEYANVIVPQENQVGAVFALQGEVRGLELLDSVPTFKKLLPKIVHGYALDAIEHEEKPLSAVPRSEDVSELMQEIASAPFKSFQAIGLGEDLRINNHAICGGALVNEGQIVHLCAFNNGAFNENDRFSQVRSASFRRKHHYH